MFPAPNARVGAGHSTKTMQRTRNTLPRDEKDVVMTGRRGTEGYRTSIFLAMEVLKEKLPFQQKMDTVEDLFIDKVMLKGGRTCW
jgi:hypothetical protein